MGKQAGRGAYRMALWRTLGGLLMGWPTAAMAQDAATAGSKLDTGDTAWLLTSTALAL